MIEVRSYRRVFDLERRIYSIDRLRLNPGGVPVRGVVYFLASLIGALTFAGLPLIGGAARTAPWYVRDLLAPGALATVLSLVRVDGRTFHLAAHALLRFCVMPRRLDGLTRTSRSTELWAPSPITLLPDGSDSRFRQLRYRGPGTVLIMVEHQVRRKREARFGLLPAGRSVRISTTGGGSPLSSPKVLSLEREASLSISASRAPGE